MSKDKLAKDLADEIFDMIDRNYPRGLIKSDLADLIGKHMTAWQTKHDLINPDVFPPKPAIVEQFIQNTPVATLLREAKERIAEEDRNDEAARRVAEDLALFGNCFMSINHDGSIDRVTPKDICGND